MNHLRKLALAIVAVAVALGTMSVVEATPASAAGTTTATSTVTGSTACRAEYEELGKAKSNKAQKKRALRKAKHQLRRAKHRYANHPTAANKTKLRKAKKRVKRAKRRLHRAEVRLAAAKLAVQQCEGTPLSGDQVSALLLQQLSTLGIPTDQLQPLVDQLSAALGGNVLPGDLDGIIAQVTDLLAGGADAGGLAAALDQVITALADAGLPLDATLVEDVVGALAGSGLSTEAIVAVLDSVTGPLAAAGLDLTQVTTAVEGLLQELTLGGVTDPNDLTNEVVAILQNVLVDQLGLPLQDVTAALDQVTTQLDAALAGVTGPVLGGLLG